MNKELINKIIGNPTKIENLEVVQFDFPDKMNWTDAKAASEELGNGWRLPSKEELNVLYENKDEIGNFLGAYYWSLTEANNSDFAWNQDIIFGTQKDHYNKNNSLSVRAIKLI
jgi:hypothetical protein